MVKEYFISHISGELEEAEGGGLVLHSDYAALEEQLEAKEAQMAEMREFLKGFVDEFDKTPSVYSVTRVLTKTEIRTMRRLVEE